MAGFHVGCHLNSYENLPTRLRDDPEIFLSSDQIGRAHRVSDRTHNTRPFRPHRDRVGMGLGTLNKIRQKPARAIAFTAKNECY
jgi:hypothetical protein